MSFRIALQDQLQAALGIDFVSGWIGGVQGERDLGCTFPVSDIAWDQDILVEQTRVGVRVWLRYERSAEPEEPIDPADLEAAAAILKTSVAANQTGLGPWFQQLMGVDYDAERNMFEAVVMGWQTNPAL